MLNLFTPILGALLLVAGRKLFWLFVGAAGFVTGLQFADRFMQGSESAALVIGLVVGLVFALLAIFLQRVAIAVAGFFAGGYILSAAAGMLGMDTGALVWITYLIGGILGILLVSYLLDWALITLSSLAGASLIVQTLNPQTGAGGVAYLVLVIAGLLIQGAVLRRERAAAAR